MERKPITFDLFVRGILCIVVLVAFIWLLNVLSGVLTPFFVAWLIAYLLFPMVKFFQYRLHLKFRILAIICSFIVVTAVLWGGFLLIVPPLFEESIRVKDLLVSYVENDAMLNSIPGTIQEYIKEHMDAQQIKAIVTQDGFMDAVKSTVPRIWDVISQSINMVSGIFSITMIILYTLFILIDYEQISEGWVKLIPQEKMRHFIQQLLADVADGMGKYFRGQGLVALCVGILFSVGFLIIDFPMAIGLGMFIGLLNMVPYLQTVGLIPTVLLAIVKAADTGQNFWVIFGMALIVFAVVQTIQDVFLTPKIMGKVTGLNSAIILLSLSIWGSLLGLLGMVIALPLTTLAITYYQRYIIKKK